MVHSTLTYHELTEHLLQTLSFRLLLFKGNSRLFLLMQGSTSLQFPAKCVPGELIPPWVCANIVALVQDLFSLSSVYPAVFITPSLG